MVRRESQNDGTRIRSDRKQAKNVATNSESEKHKETWREFGPFPCWLPRTAKVSFMWALGHWAFPGAEDFNLEKGMRMESWNKTWLELAGF